VLAPPTALASEVYVAARLAHYALFVAGIPFVRTLAFFIGVAATLVIAATLVSRAI
jgi:uncharacterized MAPEG superfamily protein